MLTRDMDAPFTEVAEEQLEVDHECAVVAILFVLHTFTVCKDTRQIVLY